MRKPDYLPSDRQCACGCGYPAAPGRKYVNDSHQDLVHNRNYQQKHRTGQHARVCPVCGISFTTKYEKKICCSKKHTDINWRRQHPESVRIISAAQVRREEGLDNPAERKRRTQVKDDDVLERLMATMPPAVLAACLEVRALNASKRQAAQITDAATGD